MEDKAIYSYSTAPEIAGLAEESFRSLLKVSEPLVQVDTARPEGAEKAAKKMTIENVNIHASLERVVIMRTEDPLLSFTFVHPTICRAFVSCLQF
jgi:hypothetical protein